MTGQTGTSPTGARARFAPEIRSDQLRAVTYRDLPEPKALKKVIGPSDVILLAGSIGSGEFVLWPYVSMQTGLALVWLATLGQPDPIFPEHGN